MDHKFCLRRIFAGCLAASVWTAISPSVFGTTVLYALTTGTAGLGQIFKSTDSAKTWTQTALTGVAFAVDPQNPNIVYSIVRTTDKKTIDSGGPAVHRSTDGGQTFTESSFNGMGPIAVDSSRTNILYAQSASSAAVFRSTDSGITWNSSLPGNAYSIRTDPAAPGVVLAVMRTTTNSIELDRSNDYGATWMVLATNFGFAVAGTQAQGAAWDVVMDGKNPTRMYIGGDGLCGPRGTTLCSLPYSMDGGKTWQTVGPPGNFGNVVIDPRNGNIFAGGVLNANGKITGIVVKSSDAGKTWTTYSKGFSTHGAQVHLDPESPSILYANQWNTYIDISNPVGGVFVSTDGGQSWTLTSVVSQPLTGNQLPAYEVISLQAVSDKNAPPAVPPVVAPAGPSISSVVNAASHAPPAQPNGGIAEGAMFLVSGSGLGPSDAVVSDTPFQTTTVGGTSIKITVNGKSVDALLYSASARQVIALLPSTTPSGAGTVTVSFNGQSSAPSPVTVVDSNFGATPSTTPAAATPS